MAAYTPRLDGVHRLMKRDATGQQQIFQIDVIAVCTHIDAQLMHIFAGRRYIDEALTLEDSLGIKKAPEDRIRLL